MEMAVDPPYPQDAGRNSGGSKPAVALQGHADSALEALVRSHQAARSLSARGPFTSGPDQAQYGPVMNILKTAKEWKADIYLRESPRGTLLRLLTEFQIQAQIWAYILTSGWASRRRLRSIWCYTLSAGGTKHWRSMVTHLRSVRRKIT